MNDRATAMLFLSMAFGTGVTAGVIAGAAIFTTTYDHDPVKMLELRSACIKTDTGAFLTWCNDYAEKFSRIKK